MSYNGIDDLMLKKSMLRLDKRRKNLPKQEKFRNNISRKRHKQQGCSKDKMLKGTTQGKLGEILLLPHSKTVVKKSSRSRGR